MIRFNRLSKQEQSEKMLYHGQLIAERAKGSYQIGLYQLEDFFVEFWYANKDNEIITELKTFMSRACLEPYLTDIDISDLIND